MITSRKVRSLAVAAVVGALAVLPGTARAAKPAIYPWPGNNTYTFVNDNLTSDCGFTTFGVTETLVYDQIEQDFSDGTVKLHNGGPNYVTYTTPYGTLTGVIAGIGETIQNPDGTQTIVGAGPAGLTTVPGSGPVLGTAGHFVGVYDPSTDTFTVLQDVGIRPDNLAAFCTYLGGPGYQFPG